MKFGKMAMITAAVLSTAIVMGSAWAAKQSPQEAAIEYRQSAFTMIRNHFGPMAGMVKGEIPFDAAVFKKNAEAVATLSQFPINGFIDRSYEGDTAAKPEIAAKMEDFRAKMETFKVEAANLAKAADGASDIAALKPQFGKVAESCKACHDMYREKD
ncbi:MAG: cytochrome c [Thiothrix sp.]|nr:MAG: cytochrome c [Thiothrix sp.]